MGGAELSGWLDSLVESAAGVVDKAKKKEAERRKPPLWLIAVVAYIAWEVTS